MALIYGFDEFSNLSENKKDDNRVICIKDFKMVLNKETCEYNNIKCSDDKLEVSIFKKGERYKRSKVLETIESKKAVYVYSNLKSDNKNLPTFLYEKFIIDSDDLDELEYSFEEFFQFNEK